MPGVVQASHHALELLDLAALAGHRRVRVVRREEADRVVAPVVRQALLDEAVVGDELVHRQQLDRGHAEPLQVLDDGGCASPAYVPRSSSGTTG